MPSLTGELDNGRIILNVGIQSTAIEVSGVSAQATAPIIPLHPYRALIDTGAQRTCITRSAAKRLGLTPRGKVRIGNVSTIESHTAYTFAVGFWYEINGGETMNTSPAYYGFSPIMGVDFKDNGDFDVLIGMDIISQGDLFIWRNGKFEFVFP